MAAKSLSSPPTVSAFGEVSSDVLQGSTLLTNVFRQLNRLVKDTQKMDLC